MKRFKNRPIVVPWDFREMSLEQLELAAEIADSLDLIEVVHVRTVSRTGVSDLDEYREKFQAELPAAYEGVKFTILCDVDLDHGKEIAQFAKSVDAGLIIVSSHGRKGISKLVLGSVAEKVVQNSHCPVLVLRA